MKLSIRSRRGAKGQSILEFGCIAVPIVAIIAIAFLVLNALSSGNTGLIVLGLIAIAIVVIVIVRRRNSRRTSVS